MKKYCIYGDCRCRYLKFKDKKHKVSYCKKSDRIISHTTPTAGNLCAPSFCTKIQSWWNTFLDSLFTF